MTADVVQRKTKNFSEQQCFSFIIQKYTGYTTISAFTYLHNMYYYTICINNLYLYFYFIFPTMSDTSCFSDTEERRCKLGPVKCILKK